MFLLFSIAEKGRFDFTVLVVSAFECACACMFERVCGANSNERRRQCRKQNAAKNKLMRQTGVFLFASPPGSLSRIQPILTDAFACSEV